jgi:peptidoglycan/xylan/chitin deacetylase (PgdA/CDA1 family)
MRLFRPWFIYSCFLPAAFFRIKTTEKVLCLTFDDGPDPGSTLALLNIIGRFNIKAIFFCNGSSAKKYPELVDTIKAEGHIIGNHGFIHLNGFKTSAKRYIDNVTEADQLTSDKFFRPPYGLLRPVQYRKLIRSYKIILWDLMAYDFDKSLGKEKSLTVLKKKIRKGSIIVLHDKPDSTAHEFLEEFILHCFSQGYRFELPAFPDEQTD